MDEIEHLEARAREVMKSAYAPYSGFTVGAALRAADGSVWTGCNVENASFGLTVCAERAAVFQAVAAGRRAFDLLYIASSGERPVAPCGACRQVLAEFSPGLEVVSVAGTTRDRWSLDELLPGSATLKGELRHAPGRGAS